MISAPELSHALPGVHAATICEAFQTTAATFPEIVALRTAGGGTQVTWGEYAARVERLAGGLAGLGVGRGDTVGFMLRNRPEFHLCDTAAMHLGATCFSIYNTSSSEQIEHLLADAANRVLVTERAFLDRIEPVLDQCPALEHVVVVDGDFGLEQVEAAAPAGFDFAAAWQAVAPGDVVVLIYTSGTTGPPKGVELSHGNLMWEVRAFEGVFPVAEPGNPVCSYLPMAHAAERCFSHYHGIPRALTVTCVEEPQGLVGALPEVRPTWLMGVPRVFEKLRAAMLASGAAPDELRTMLGLDRLEVAVVGGAPIAPEVLEYFASLGITLNDVWGMTELSAVVTVNGRPFPGVDVKLAEDGEILVRGPVVMQGYRNRPDATAETIDADGWLHTGDVGAYDADGLLRIVDRKKELIINAGGKNMSPANIEGRIKLESPLVGHAVAIGDRRPYNVALLVPDPLLLGGRAADDPAVADELRAAVARANGALSRVEQIKRFAVVGDDWQPSSAELTPTLKLKRRQITERYGKLIEELYADEPPAHVIAVP